MPETKNKEKKRKSANKRGNKDKNEKGFILFLLPNAQKCPPNYTNQIIIKAAMRVLFISLAVSLSLELMTTV
jgi:hypothetical protein